jgi:glycogen debranching enzyme
LKHEKAFAMIESTTGDVDSIQSNNLSGLFVNDTRHVSALEVDYGRNMVPVREGRLSADNIEFSVGLSDADGKLEATTSVILKDNVLYRKIELRNNSVESLHVPLHLSTGSDFIAMFALRFPKDCREIYEQYHPERRTGSLGRHQPVTHKFNRTALVFSYKGLDNNTNNPNLKNGLRYSFVSCSEKPAAIKGTGLDFKFVLNPGECKSIYVEAGEGKAPSKDASAKRYDEALSSLREDRNALLSKGAKITVEDPATQAWVDDSMRDIALLTHREKTGLYLDAGLPWYVTKFGRDPLTAADYMVWQNPDYAAGVLRYLASNQATEDNPDTAAERGKIMHEERFDELMFAINPRTSKPYRNFRRIYAGDDQTMLFITTAENYFRRTGDAQLIRDILPQLDLAMEWMVKRFTDDGFFGYGWNKDLSNQRMYDSEFSMFYANGDHRVSYPRKPLEIQGYAYAAFLAYQRLATAAGRPEAELEKYGRMAEKLKDAVNQKFWIPDTENGIVTDPDKGHYAHGMDGEGVLCPEMTTTSGDIVWTGIVPEMRAKSIAEKLLHPRFFNGGGIRTVPNDSVRYASDGYHIGSVWPHINSQIASGLSQYGMHAEAIALIEANQRVVEEFGGSLPELFEGDTDYPEAGFRKFKQACHPQAWSAAAALRDVQTALGLVIDAGRGELRIDPSAMSAKWGKVKIENLKIGGGTVTFETAPQGAIHVLSSQGTPLRVIDGRTGTEVPQPAPAARALSPSFP